MSPAVRHSIRSLALLAALVLSPLAPAAASAAAPPATSTPTVWGCFPGRAPDPCDGSLATTVLSSTVLQPRKVARVETPVAAPSSGVDCFYVYPTVVTSLAQNAPKHLTNEVASILHYQAARFSQDCNVYAPIYRQATLAGIAAPVAGSAKDQDPAAPQPNPALKIAYADVLAAWKDYLAKENHGRGIVLIGHSQGSGLLIRLMHDEIDPDPELRARLVSAIVPGGNLTVAAGRRTGGDLDHIPTCASGDETGCVMAWSTFGQRPTRNSLFGLAGGTLRAATGVPTKPGTEVVCTNPAELSGDSGHLQPIARTESFPGLIGLSLKILYFGLPPKASTPWVVPGERYTARCVDSDGAHVLMVKAASKTTIVPIAAPWPDWGLHLADVNLPLGNLITIVRRQAAAYVAAHP